MDDPRHLAFARSGSAGQKNRHIECCDGSNLFQHASERTTPTYEPVGTQAATNCPGRIARWLFALTRQQASHDWSEMAREGLRGLTVFFREASGLDPALQVEDPHRRAFADRCAKNRVNAPGLDAVPLPKPRIQPGRCSDNRTAPRDRLGDDAARDRGAHRLHLLLSKAVPDRPTATALAITAVIDLQQSVSGANDLDNRLERLGKETLEVDVLAKEEELAIEVPLSPNSRQVDAERLVVSRHLTPCNILDWELDRAPLRRKRFLRRPR